MATAVMAAAAVTVPVPAAMADDPRDTDVLVIVAVPVTSSRTHCLSNISFTNTDDPLLFRPTTLLILSLKTTDVTLGSNVLVVLVDTSRPVSHPC